MKVLGAGQAWTNSGRRWQAVKTVGSSRTAPKTNIKVFQLRTNSLVSNWLVVGFTLDIEEFLFLSCNGSLNCSRINTVEIMNN